MLDRKFGDRKVITLLHVIPGGIFLLLAPFQFSPTIRNRHRNIHRWSGRVLLVLLSVSAVAGLYFGLLMPFGGSAEAVAIALFGALLLVAIPNAYLAIRRRQVARHRAWMIRVFAVAIGISTVRVVAAVLDPTLTPAGFAPSVIFVLSIWIGWGLTLGVAEFWIAHTRPRAVTAPMAMGVS